MASSSRPPMNTRTCQSRPLTGGRNDSPSCALGPINSTFSTVPSPGICRSGSHISSTATPTRLVINPKLQPLRSEMPWLRTSQGAMPIPARIINDEAMPNRNSPSSSCSRRVTKTGVNMTGTRGGRRGKRE